MFQLRALALKLKNTYTLDEKAVLLLVASAFISVYAIGVCASVLFARLLINGGIGRMFRSVKGSGLLLLFGIGAIAASAAHGGWFEIAVALGIFIALIVLVFIRRVMTPRLMDGVIDLCCFLSIISFLVGLAQLLFIVKGEFGHRFESVFYNPNFYATIIEAVTLMALYRLIRPGGQSRRKRGYYAMVMAVNLMGLGICQSRTAFVVIIITSLILILFVNRRFLPVYLGIVALIAAITFFTPELLPRLDTLGEDVGIKFSIWGTAVNGVWEHPLWGGGCFTYRRIYEAYQGFPVNHAHNIVLELALNYGLIGCALALTYFTFSVKGIIRLYHRRIDKQRSALALVVILAFIMHGVVDATIFWPQTGILAALVLGCCDMHENTNIELISGRIDPDETRQDTVPDVL